MKSFGWILSIIATAMLLFGSLMSISALAYDGPSDAPWGIDDHLIYQLCCPVPILLAGGAGMFYGIRLIRSSREKEQAVLERFPPERPMVVRVPERRRKRYKMPNICVACGSPAVQMAHKVGLFSDKNKSGVQPYVTTHYITFPLCAKCQEPGTRVEKKRIKGAVDIRPSREYPGNREITFSNAEFARHFDELNQDRFEFSIKDYIR